MTKAVGIKNENGRLMISGDLDFKTVPELWNQGMSLLASCDELHFDFENVMFSNSAGIALIIEWMKYAKESQKQIYFHHIPSQLNSIMKATGVNFFDVAS